jgi:hypothetical protein
MGGLLQKKEKSSQVITVNSQVGREVNCGICGKLFTRNNTYHEFNRHLIACKQRAEKNNLQNLIKELKDASEELEAEKHLQKMLKEKKTTSKKSFQNKIILKEDSNSGMLLFDNLIINNKKTNNYDDMKNNKEFELDSIKGFPFEEKIEYFRKFLKGLKVDWREGFQTLILDRENFLKQSVEQISNIDLYKELKINFKGEVSHDAGGLIREWYTIVFKKLLSNELNIFEKADTDEYSFCIHSNCLASIENLDLFYFIGKILAKALLDNLTVNACFNKLIYKLILDEKLELDDLIFINKPVIFLLNLAISFIKGIIQIRQLG